MNIAVASLVGVISGQYIFKEPLENYWKEKRLEEAAAAKQNGGGTAAPSSTPPPPAKA